MVSKHFLIGVVVLVGVVPARLFAEILDFSPSLPQMPDSSLAEALRTASPSEILIIGPVLILALIGAIAIVKRIVGKKQNIDSFMREKARYEEKIIRQDELNEELEKKQDDLKYLRDQVLDSVKYSASMYGVTDDEEYGVLSDDKKIIFLVQKLIEKISENQSSFDARIEEKEQVIKDHEVSLDSERRMRLDAEKERGLAVRDMLDRVYLDQLLKATTQRLNSAGGQYQNAWDAGRSEFPALLQALREYAENHYDENDLLNSFEDMKALSYVSEEAIRIAQYDVIIRLYNERISALRDKEMNEEDQEEAILAMKRLRDREIDALEQA